MESPLLNLYRKITNPDVTSRLQSDRADRGHLSDYSSYRRSGVIYLLLTRLACVGKQAGSQTRCVVCERIPRHGVSLLRGSH